MDELREHLKSCADNNEIGRGAEFPYLLQHVGIGMAVGVLGAILFFFMLPRYLGSNVVVPGGSVVFSLGGIVALLGGPGYALYRFYDFFAGTRLSAPAHTVKTFVKGFDDGNWGRIWKCLTPKARESFGNPEDYKKNLKQLHSKIVKTTIKNLELSSEAQKNAGNTFEIDLFYSFKHDNVKVSELSENACIADFDLIVEQTRRVNKVSPGGYRSDFGSCEDGKVIFPHSIGLVLHDGNWLLTSGMNDLK